MGAHRDNPVALANAVPQRRGVPVIDLGDSVGLLGLALKPIKDPVSGEFRVAVVAAGGRVSDLMPLQPREVVIGFIPVVPLDMIKKLLLGEIVDGPGALEAEGSGEPPAAA